MDLCYTETSSDSGKKKKTIKQDTYDAYKRVQRRNLGEEKVSCKKSQHERETRISFWCGTKKEKISERTYCQGQRKEERETQNGFTKLDRLTASQKSLQESIKQKASKCPSRSEGQGSEE
ncbi:hypothetical protein P7K49_001049 [Saguinus oedipus]|uniref:Uncharacterized protein n=1 Tax=Saguinus oedipus TaxID=9490 RepID=A0ABQ9WFX9_SAGOE|nr:hypothetical protein P7K49_001049 [Saguinus oedipus]